jgi:exosome complex RNA-binding protein Csl4
LADAASFGVIVAAVTKCSSFLYRPSGVALVAMAQGGVVARRIAANIANLPELLRK